MNANTAIFQIIAFNSPAEIKDNVLTSLPYVNENETS